MADHVDDHVEVVVAERRGHLGRFELTGQVKSVLVQPLAFITSSEVSQLPEPGAPDIHPLACATIAANLNIGRF